MSDQEEALEISEQDIEQALSSLAPQEQSTVWSPHTVQYYGSKTRSILVGTTIDERLSNAISSQAQELHFQDQESPIFVHINSPGGSIIDALAIYDMLMCISNPIVTIVNGGCFSAAILVALAGDTRLAAPNSIYFHHQPALEVNVDSMVEMKSNQGFYNWCKGNTDEIMRKRAGISTAVWNETFDTTTSMFFNAHEALEHGFCTAIMEHMDKPALEIIEEES